MMFQLVPSILFVIMDIFTLTVRLIANIIWTLRVGSYNIVHVISAFYPYLVSISTNTFQSPHSLKSGLDNGCPTVSHEPDLRFSLLSLALNHPSCHTNHAVPLGIVNMGWCGQFLVVKRKYMVSASSMLCLFFAQKLLECSCLLLALKNALCAFLGSTHNFPLHLYSQGFSLSELDDPTDSATVINYKVFSFLSMCNMIHDFLLFFINTQHVLSIPFTSIQFWAKTYWLQLSGGIPSAPTEVPLNLVTNWLLTNREERLICDFGLFDYPSQQLVNDAEILYNFSKDIEKDIINVNKIKNYNVSVSKFISDIFCIISLYAFFLQNLRQDVVDSVAVITNYAYQSTLKHVDFVTPKCNNLQQFCSVRVCFETNISFTCYLLLSTPC